MFSLHLDLETRSGACPSRNTKSSTPILVSLNPLLPLASFSTNSSPTNQVRLFAMTQRTKQLRIIAEPKAFYRERYESEHYKTGNLVPRYIRAEVNPLNLEYPTVE